MSITQTQTHCKTGPYGDEFGRYTLYLTGEIIGTSYASTYQAALQDYHQLLNDRREAATRTDDWYVCECGATVDIDFVCERCAPQPDPDQIPFNGEPSTEAEDVTRLWNPGWLNEKVAF